MKISLISSGSDIGHKFIQDGIIRLFSEVGKNTFDLDTVFFNIINKHAPIYSCDYLKNASQEILKSDLIIIAGGPIIWPFVEKSDWAEILGDKIIEAGKLGIPTWAIAVGSCYGINQNGCMQKIRKEEIIFIKKLLKHCSLITTRDKVVNEIFNQNNIENCLLPCIAYYAMDANINSEKSSKVLFNFMKGGGHHDYLNNISNIAWHESAKLLLNKLSINYQVEFLSHSVSEFETTFVLDHKLTSNLIVNKNDLYNAAKSAFIGICNRIHASVGLAGMHIPALTIGTDTRILTLEEFGLPTLCLSNSNYETINKSIDSLINNNNIYADKLTEITQKSTFKYKDLISKLMLYL